LLADDALVDGPAGAERNPLEGAARHGHLQTVMLLVSRGASVKPQNHDVAARTAISSAASRGHCLIVSFLLEHMQRPGDLRRALCNAASGGHIDVIRAFHQTRSLLASSDWAYALDDAANAGQLDAVIVLVESGADVRSMGYAKGPRKTASVLHSATYGGDAQIVAYLSHIWPNLAFARDSQGRTPLHLAASLGQRATSILLLETQWNDIVTRPRDLTADEYLASAQTSLALLEKLAQLFPHDLVFPRLLAEGLRTREAVRAWEEFQ